MASIRSMVALTTSTSRSIWVSHRACLSSSAVEFDYSGLALELEPKSQTFADVLFPSFNKYGSNFPNNYFYCRGITQPSTPSSAKLLSRGATTEILNV